MNILTEKKRIADFLTGIGISTCIFLSYINTFSVPFQFDDIPCITGNHAIMHPEKIGKLFFYWPTRFVTYLSFAINYKIHAFNVSGYHIVNLLIHIGCSLIVWQIAKRLLSNVGIKNSESFFIPFFAGLIFGIHPVQTQAVTYIYQRHTCLASFFILSSFLCWMNALSEKRHKNIWYFFSFILTILAMFTKEISIVMPFFILIYYLWFKNELNIQIKPWKVIIYAVFLFASFSSIVLLTHSINPAEIKQVNSMKEGPDKVITQKEYFLTQGQGFLTYFKLLLFPVNQNIDYDVTISKSIFSPPETLAGFLLMLSTAISGLIFFKKNKIISFSAMFFIVSILPQSSIIPKPDLIVEHRMYLAIAGFAIALPYIFYFSGKKREFLITFLLFCLSLVYGILTYQRNNVWKDPLILWNDAVVKSPTKARPYLNRGLAYAGKGDIEKALADYNTAIKLNPWYIEAYNNRGILFASIKKTDEALKDFNKAIELNPGYAIAYNNRGVLYSSMGLIEDAFNDFNTALKLEPLYVDALKNRAIAYLMQRNFKQAIEDFSSAIEIHPKNGQLYNYRAIVFLLNGEKEKAVKDAKMAVRLGYRIDPVLKSIFENGQ